MFKIIKKQIRPNTSVDFWQGADDPALTDDFRNYFYENYVLSGKFISITPEISSDNLELTSTAIWNSESDANEYVADVQVQQGTIKWTNDHCQANGITQVTVSKQSF